MGLRRKRWGGGKREGEIGRGGEEGRESRCVLDSCRCSELAATVSTPPMSTNTLAGQRPGGGFGALIINDPICRALMCGANCTMNLRSMKELS